MTVGNAGRIGIFRLQENDDLLESVKKKSQESKIRAGTFTLIGTLKHAVLGYYRNGEYQNIRFEGPLEIAACTGNVAVDETGEVIVHAHLVVSDEKCQAFGGHLMKDSLVGATAELIILEATSLNMVRVFDEKTKLKLLKLG